MVKDFRWLLDLKTASTFTPETTQNIVNVINSSTISSSIMMNIPGSFDFMTFAKFMDANPTIDYFLDFDDLIPQEYSTMLQEYLDKLLENGLSKYPPVQLQFPR